LEGEPMATLKTQPTTSDVPAFLEAVADPGRRADCRALMGLMQEVSGEPGRLWGTSIVGFGSYHYEYESGREGDWFLVGFAPRKNDLTIYVTGGLEGHPEILAKLGKHKSRGSCLYVKKLADVDLAQLRQLVELSVEAARQKNRS
jgi:hypothetical protein